MLRVALTGGIATGKSYVRGRLDQLGVPTIDADVLARRAVASGTAGLAAVVQRFGDGVLDSSGTLDRRKLGSVVFADPAARRDLEAIIHPFVRQQTEAWFGSIEPAQHVFAVADIPLLYETGSDILYDAVIVAACSPEEQVRRVVARDRVSEEEARQRLAAQMPIEDKVHRADYVIRTEGTHAETDRQLDGIVNALRARA